MLKYISLLSGFLLILAACSGPSSSISETERLTQYVNHFIGTGYHGHTFPGAAWPFGQVQLSPDNGTQGWDWCPGYHYSDSMLAGFSHLHLSGTGIGDLADISFLPVTKEITFVVGEENHEFVARYAGQYIHDEEFAEPGYYAVTLKNYRVKAELTVTGRAGMQRYTFPEEGEKNMIINLGFAINWDKPYKTEISVVDSCLVTGSRLSHGWAADQHVYFAVRFSQPIQSSAITDIGGEGRSVGCFSFTGRELIAKVGISSVSTQDALENLDSSLPDWDFDAARKAVSDAWEKELSVIRITSADNNLRTIFYTSLYHTMIAPALFSDLNGEFKGVKGDVQKAEGYNRYTVFSLWDTYRALHPLLTITQPERVNDMVKSMLETSMFDRDGMGLYDSLGYMPADKVSQSVAKSEEVAIDDWCVAAAAQKLDLMGEAQYFRSRSKNYISYFDAETGFMRGKLSNGEWTSPFDPAFSKHEGSDYTEGNAWQYLWLVPHDVSGLINLLGGEEPFADKLDQLFKVEEGVKGVEASADISGLIGAYAHGNEPGHHTTFLFNFNAF